MLEADKKPVVSVIIPAFNAEKTIGRAIESILSQDADVACEILVVDDHSTDKTNNIVGRLEQSRVGIRCLKNHRKKGPSGARNTGLGYAKGQYIAFLDADDYWKSNHLSEGLRCLNQTDSIDVIFFNFEIREDSDDRTKTTWFKERTFASKLVARELDDGVFLIKESLFLPLIRESFIHLQSVLINHEVISGIWFDENVKRAEDRDFFINLSIVKKAQFAFKDIITGFYIRSENSLTSENIENSLLTILDRIYLFSKYLEFQNLTSKEKSETRNAIRKSLLSGSYLYRTRNELRPAAKLVTKSFKYGWSRNQFLELGKVFYRFFQV